MLAGDVAVTVLALENGWGVRGGGVVDDMTMMVVVMAPVLPTFN